MDKLQLNDLSGVAADPTVPCWRIDGSSTCPAPLIHGQPHIDFSSGGSQLSYLLTSQCCTKENDLKPKQQLGGLVLTHRQSYQATSSPKVDDSPLLGDLISGLVMFHGIGLIGGSYSNHMLPILSWLQVTLPLSVADCRALLYLTWTFLADGSPGCGFT